ncbi:MAG: hypothetical protein CMJ63_05110 [Planctomycetaceae bacterium]|jgi:hypothetical protein|nr:hypothetical protein [Planctomycetaceae bacterium]MDP7189259.1 hypothetical protein [Phycisphaerales bacterium]
MTAHLAISVATCSLLVLGTGCHKSKWPKRTPLTAETAAALNQLAEQNLIANELASSSFQGDSWGIGAIPWNSTTLPLLSPNGQWIATSTGDIPSNAMRLALPGASVPEDAKIEIWEVLPSRSGIRLQNTISGSVLLTDSADDEGFLVESPRADGSRWIGEIDWRTGNLQWLVQDEHVNTMPSLGPRGRLAWCVRTQQEIEFSLAIRFQDEREFVLPVNDGEWLLPMWSDRSSRLSAWRLGEDGTLSIVSIDGESPDTLESSIKQALIMAGANRWDALRATANRSIVQGLQPSRFEEVIFYHPIRQRIAVWRPMAANSDRVISLAEGSIDAVHDHEGNFLLTMPDGLHWQDLSNLSRICRVDHVPLYARRTTDPMLPYVLLDPETNVVRVRGMRGASPPTQTNQPRAEAVEQ